MLARLFYLPAIGFKAPVYVIHLRDIHSFWMILGDADLYSNVDAEGPTPRTPL